MRENSALLLAYCCGLKRLDRIEVFESQNSTDIIPKHPYNKLFPSVVLLKINNLWEQHSVSFDSSYLRQ